MTGPKPQREAEAVDAGAVGSDAKLFVTQPFLPPLDELTPMLEELWLTRQLTNGGVFHQRFEAELGEYLGVPHVSLFTNATIALVTALQALNHVLFRQVLPSKR